MPWIFGSAIALIVAGAVGVLGFVTPGWFLVRVFDSAAVEKGVQQVLRDAYKLGAVETVACPPEVPVVPDDTFRCRLRIGEKDQRVTVTIKDERGTYAVGYPH